MTSRSAAVSALVLVLGLSSSAPHAQPASSLVERVGDTGFLQLQAENFNALDARQQALAYWLT